MTTYVSNAFSIQMIADLARELPHGCDLTIKDVPADFVKQYLQAFPFVSCVGHADTAAIFSADLGMEIPVNRVSIKLNELDQLFVGQYIGPRLPEGITVLPDGAKIVWYHVEIHI